MSVSLPPEFEREIQQDIQDACLQTSKIVQRVATAYEQPMSAQKFTIVIACCRTVVPLRRLGRAGSVPFGGRSRTLEIAMSTAISRQTRVFPAAGVEVLQLPTLKNSRSSQTGLRKIIRIAGVRPDPVLKEGNISMNRCRRWIVNLDGHERGVCRASWLRGNSRRQTKDHNNVSVRSLFNAGIQAY